MNKQPITTISLDERAKNEVYQNLTALVGDFFTFTSYSCDAYKALKNPTDKFVLLTAPMLVDIIAPYLPPSCKYFVARREIDPQSLHKLFSLPKGVPILNVNNSLRNAVEVINELQALNLNDLNLIPFAPGSELSGTYEYAITTGQLDLVPPGIKHITDIGSRRVSIMSIAELFFYFKQVKLPEIFLTQRYTRHLLATTGMLYEKQRKNLRLQNYMNILLANFDDGVLVMDPQNIVLFHNSMASTILDNKLSTGIDLGDVNSDLAKSDNETDFIKIHDEVVYVSRKSHKTNDGEFVNIIALKSTSQISEIDNQYAKYKKNSGHTARFVFSDIVYGSSAMRDVIAIAERIATKEAGILLSGDSGTGKELFAQAIHNGSQRKDGPFVALNCAALSESLLESELFGYEEGAFTGAVKGGKKGVFEVANDGTIFLDEIGDAPPSIQLKLLRVLQEREVMRVAANKVIPINVRVIAATNKDLPALVRAGKFREDLYFRLNVINLRIPPLKERTGDIELLLHYYLNRFGCSISKLDQLTRDMLFGYSWPGNIRELKNIAEYIATVYDITPDLYQSTKHMLFEKVPPPVKAPPKDSVGTFRKASVKTDLDKILAVLAHAKQESLNLGRNKIQSILEGQGSNLSIQQIKTRIDILKKKGYAEAFNGKGTEITPAGEAYLRDRY